MPGDLRRIQRRISEMGQTPWRRRGDSNRRYRFTFVSLEYSPEVAKILG